MFSGKNFSKAMKRNKITSLNLSLKFADIGLKLGKDAVDSYRKGVVKSPDMEALDFVANLCGVTVVDFLEKKDEIKKKITKEELVSNLDNYIDLIPNINVPPTLKQIELIRGYPTLPANTMLTEENMKNVKHIYIDKQMIEKAYREKDLKSATIIGDSMLPYMASGDVAIYYPTPKFIAPGKYVLQTPHGLEFKSVSMLRNGSLELGCENSSYPNETVAKAEIDTVEFMGLIVGRILKG